MITKKVCVQNICTIGQGCTCVLLVVQDRTGLFKAVSLRMIDAVRGSALQHNSGEEDFLSAYCLSTGPAERACRFQDITASS